MPMTSNHFQIAGILLIVLGIAEVAFNISFLPFQGMHIAGNEDLFLLISIIALINALAVLGLFFALSILLIFIGKTRERKAILSAGCFLITFTSLFLLAYPQVFEAIFSTTKGFENLTELIGTGFFLISGIALTRDVTSKHVRIAGVFIIVISSNFLLGYAILGSPFQDSVIILLNLVAYTLTIPAGAMLARGEELQKRGES